MKKTLAILLAIVLLFGSFPAYAYNIPKVKNVTKAEDKIEALKQKDIIIGYEDGSLGLERYIKRSELTKVLVHAVGEEKVAEALKGKMDLFTDVARTHWANGYIAYAKNYPNPINKVPFVNGYPDGSFRPENNITNAEMLKILVVLAKRDLTDDMVKNAKWPSDWVEWAKNEKIIGKDVGLNDLALNEPAIREDSFVALYNAFVQLEKTGPLKEETKKEPIKTKPNRRPSSGKGDYVKPTPTPTPKPPAKDPNKDLKDAVSNFIDTIDLGIIEKVADPKGKAIYNIPPKAEALKTLKDNIKRAKELIGKKTLTADEVKELEALKPVKHEKKDKLINGLANDISHGFVVNWEVQGPRTVKNQDDSRKYTELTDDQIIVKSNAVELEDGTYKAYINYVTKDQYTAGGTIDTVSGATPKYKKQELDPKFYTLEKTGDGFIFKMNVNEPGYKELIENTSILKPIIKVTVADRVKIENGDLVFVKDQAPTPGTTDAAAYPPVAPTDKTQVADIENITEAEKTAAKDAIVAANPKATEVVINADGSATLTYADGSENTLAKVDVFEAAPVVEEYGLTLPTEVTAEPVANGTADTSKYAKNTEITLSIAVPTNKEIVSFMVGGEEKSTEVTTENKYTFTIIKDTEVTVTFKDKEPVVEKFTVTFDSDGGSAVASQTVEKGKMATAPTVPTKDGYTFVEWQLNGVAYDFTTLVEDDITLTGIWEKVYNVTLVDTDPVSHVAVDKTTAKAGEKITITPKTGYEVKVSDGTNEITVDNNKFIMPASDVTITVTKLEFNPNNLTAIEITTPPTKIEYFDGQEPDNTGMIVTLKDNKGMTKEVPADQLEDNNITTVLDLDNQKLVASKDNLKAETDVTIYRVYVNFKFECGDPTGDPQCEEPHIFEAKYGYPVSLATKYNSTLGKDEPINVEDLENKAIDKAPAGQKFDGWNIIGAEPVKTYTSAELGDLKVIDSKSTPLNRIDDTSDPDAIPYYNLEVEPVYVNKEIPTEKTPKVTGGGKYISIDNKINEDDDPRIAAANQVNIDWYNELLAGKGTVVGNTTPASVYKKGDAPTYSETDRFYFVRDIDTNRIYIKNGQTDEVVTISVQGFTDVQVVFNADGTISPKVDTTTPDPETLKSAPMLEVPSLGGNVSNYAKLTNDSDDNSKEWYNALFINNNNTVTGTKSGILTKYDNSSSFEKGYSVQDLNSGNGGKITIKGIQDEEITVSVPGWEVVKVKVIGDGYGGTAIELMN